MAVLFRIEHAAVQKIRVFSSDCELDAGGLPVHWLTSVNAAESVALLAGHVAPARDQKPGTPPLSNAALSAIALHADPAALLSLEHFVAPGQAADVRKRAAFWLGSTRGREGFSTLRRLAETDTDSAFRRELAFPLSLCTEPAAIDVLIQLARGDSNGEVRKQALLWLGQKEGAKVAGTLADVVANDPETANKERAVFALSRLPDGEGVTRLIEVAQSNPNLAVRKRALFWLGQANDPRALDYIAQVLTRK
jgi:HEAT repeat protein